MAIPLKKGMNFYVEYRERPATYQMASYEAYTEYYGIAFVMSGDRKLETPDKTYFVHAGNISPMPRNVYHRTSATSGQPFSRYGVRFTPYIAQRLTSHLGEDVFLDVMSHLSYELEPRIQKEMLSLFEKLLYEYEHYDNHSEFIMQGLLEQIVIGIVRHGKVAESAEIKLNITDDLILHSLAYIDKHYAENPSIDQLSSLVGLSSSHFMKRFRECVGSSYKTYLRRYKIKLAQELLTNTAQSIDSIAEELGYCNTNYLSSSFKKVTGTTPLHFRKSHQQQPKPESSSAIN